MNSSKLYTGLRVLLGLLYTVFGLNYFLQFLPQPPLPEPAMNFLMALINSGYLLTWVKVSEVLGGVLLLSGLATPIALILLAPITLNVVMFHLMLAPASGLIAYVILALHLYLGFSRFDVYRPLFKRS